MSPDSRLSLHVRSILRVVSVALFLFAMFSVAIAYITRSIDFVAPLRWEAASHGTVSIAELNPTRTPPDLGRFVQVALIAAIVCVSSFLYLGYALGETIMCHSLAGMRLREVLLFWLLCFAYLADALLAFWYSQTDPASPTGRTLYIAPYIVHFAVYSWLAISSGTTHDAHDSRKQVTADFYWAGIGIKALDIAVLCSVLIAAWFAFQHSAEPFASPHTLLETTSPKHWAVLVIALALMASYSFRRSIARNAIVWDIYRRHLEYLSVDQRRLAEFTLPGLCHTVVDLGCGASMRIRELFNDPRVRWESDSLCVAAVDRQFTDARVAEYRDDVVVLKAVNRQNVHLKNSVKDLLGEPAFTTSVCRGGGYVLIHMSHGIYYRELVQQFATLVKSLRESQTPFVCVVRGSGLKSLWSVAAAIVSLRPMGASAALFWRQHHLPELCLSLGIGPLLRDEQIPLTREDLEKFGENPDDIIDQHIEWTDAAATNCIELLSAWHGKWVRDALREVAVRWANLDRDVRVPTEDIQFWLAAPEARPKTIVKRVEKRPLDSALERDWNPFTQVLRVERGPLGKVEHPSTGEIAPVSGRHFGQRGSDDPSEILPQNSRTGAA